MNKFTITKQEATYTKYKSYLQKDAAKMGNRFVIFRSQSHEGFSLKILVLWKLVTITQNKSILSL